jgi:drug/metabolite transporter (DMT)-like permease
LFLTMAHRRAPAPILAPFMYTQIVWMIAAGFLVFGDTPSVWTLAGVAVVILSGLYLLYREKRMRAEDSLKAQISE